MLKYIQDILQNLLKKTPKPKFKNNKTKTNSFVTSNRKTSIHPGIQSPIGNEKHELENTQHSLKIKKTYDMLMKKFINPNLDLIPQSNSILEQIKNMDFKKQKELFSNLIPNNLFAKTKKKTLSIVPYDKKLDDEEKVHHKSTKSFAIGWSGQATTKESLKPIVEIASKYPLDIDSAFFYYTDVNELNTKESGRKSIKKPKKISQRRRKPITHSTTNKTKPKKSVQLIKEIPKSHIGKLYRLNAEKKERALQQSVLNSSQVAKISDPPAKCKILPVSLKENFSGNSDGNAQSYKYTKICKGMKIVQSDEKELKNVDMIVGYEEFSRNNETQNIIQGRVTENIKEFHKKYLSNERMSPGNNFKEKNTEDSLLHNLNVESADLKCHQNNSDSTSETSHEVASTSNELGSRLSPKNDNTNLAPDICLNKSENIENNKSSIINNSRHNNSAYLDSIKSVGSDMEIGADEIQGNTLPVIKTEGVGVLEENLSLETKKESMNPDISFDKNETNQALGQTLENIDVSNALKNTSSFEENNMSKEPSIYKKPNYINQLHLKNTRLNEVVCNKVLTKEKVDSDIGTSYSKCSIKEKKYKKDNTVKTYKNQTKKDVYVAGEKAYNNDKILKNFKESLILSKTWSENKSTELNNISLLSTVSCSASNITQKLNNKSTEPLAKKNKIFQTVSSKAIKQRREGLPKSNSKIYIKKGTTNDTNKTYPYSSCFNQVHKGSSNLKNDERAAMLTKSKLVEGTSNKSKEKILSSNVLQASIKMEQKQKNSIGSNLEKQTANKADEKVVCNFNAAKSDLIRKGESVSNKTKPKNVQLVKSLFVVSSPVLSKDSYRYNCSLKSNKKKDTAAFGNLDEQSGIKNVLKYNTTKTGFKKTHKLHSKKLASKCPDLKMYGKGKNVRSLTSVHIVCKDNENPINRTSSLTKRIEPRKCFARNFRDSVVHSGNKIFPFGVQNRNLCTVQDTASIIINYLFKKFSTNAAKNLENSYFGHRTTNNFLEKEKIKVNTNNVMNFNDNLATKTNVKRTIIRNHIQSPQHQRSEPVDTSKMNGKIGNVTEKLFQKRSGDTTASRRKPLSQKKEYSFEVLYERNNAKSKDRLIQNLQQQDNHIKTSKQKLNTFYSKNLSHNTPNPFKYVEDNKTKCDIISHNTNRYQSSIQLKEGYNIVHPKQITKHESCAYKTIRTNVPNSKKLQKNNKDRIFEITNKDYLAIKPYQITELTSYNKLNSLQKESKKNNLKEKKGHSLFHITEGFPDKSDLETPENFKHHLSFKETNSLPNLHHTYLEPNTNSTNPQVHNPIIWKSKSDRLKHVLLLQNRTIRSKVRNMKKRTLIKPSIVHNNQFKCNNTVALSDIINSKGENNKIELINASNKNVLTYKKKENQNNKVNSFLQGKIKPLATSISYTSKTTALENKSNFGKQVLNKYITLSQKQILPLLSTTSLNRKSSKAYLSKMPHKSGMSGTNLSKGKVELIKRPVSKPILHASKTAVSKTLLDSSTPDKLAAGKRSDTKLKNEVTVSNLLNWQRYDKTNTPSSEIKNNKYLLAMQTAIKTNVQTNENIFEKDKKSEKENPEIKLSEFKKLQDTWIRNTLSDSRVPNNLATGKSVENKRKKEGMVGNLLDCQGKNSDKTNCCEIKDNKSHTLTMQTDAKSNEITNITVFKKDEKSEKEKPLMNEFKQLQQSSNTKTVQNGSEINCFRLKEMKEEPKMLAESFDLNFNLPLNIMTQNYKIFKCTHKENDSGKPESTKESNVMQHYNQLQLLEGGKLDKHKKARSDVVQQEDKHNITGKRPSKLDKSKPVQTVSKVGKQEKSISTSRKGNEQRDGDSLNESYKLYSSIPTLPLKILNTKSHQIKVKSSSGKQDHSEMIKPIAITGTDKKIKYKPPRFPVGHLAKHFMKKEKHLTAYGKSNKLEQEKTSNTSKTAESIKGELKKTSKHSKQICLADEEKENKSDMKKEAIMITGSNLTLHFEKLIKSKGRDKFYLSTKTEENVSTDTANLKHENEVSKNDGEFLRVKKQAKRNFIGSKLENNKTYVPNECLEKIVDYGIQKSRSNLHNGLMQSLKSLNNSEKLSANRKTKNLKSKQSSVNSSNVPTKIQDQLSSPVSLVSETNKMSISSDDIGKIKNKIRSKNTFRVFKSNKATKKRQLQLLDRNYQFGKDSFQNKCEKEAQLKNRYKITRKNLPTVSDDNSIYHSPVDPRSKGIYVLQIKPSKAEKASSVNSSEVLKTIGTVSFNKKCIPYNIPDQKTNEQKGLRSH